MFRWIVRAVVVLGVIAASIVGPGAGGSPGQVQARGEDVCAEPNDEFQAACSLGERADALGFIQRADDVDAYRFEAADFNTRTRVTLADLPLPYQGYVVNWRGDVIANTQAAGDGLQVAEVVLPLPGSYYVFVRSPDGRFSEGEPYRLGIEFPDPKTRRIIYQSDYRPGTNDQEDTRPNVDFIRSGGKLTIALKKEGSIASPFVGNWIMGNAPSEFALTVDSRLSEGSNGGFRIWFGRQEDFRNVYSVIVNTNRQQVLFTKFVDDVPTQLVPWKDVPSIAQAGEVNRSVIQSDGASIRMTINGAEAFQVSGESVPAGVFGVGTITWAEPLSASFDNTLATTADSGPPPAGTVLMTEDFDSPDQAIISTSGTLPDQNTYAILDGEYQVKQLTPGSSWRLLPASANTDNATIAINARLLDPTPGRFVQVGCRDQQSPNGASHYRLVMVPATGRFKVGRWTAGEETLIVPWSSGASIKRDSAVNRIELTCAGSTIVVSVNGSEIASVEDSTYSTGRFMFGSGVFTDNSGPADGRFDDLVVTQR
ncbi:MAG: hypothetical protein AB7K36_13495 [Chloroflexota bacterium]